MRRRLALAVALWPAVVAAQPAAPVPTVLHLAQSAERQIVRDRLHIAMRVEETAADPLSVQQSINRRMAAALAEAHKRPGVEVASGSYYVGEEHPANAKPQWRGSQTLLLSGGNTAELLQLAGRLQSAGLVTSSLAYEASPEEIRGAEADLTSEALAALERRAAAVARLLHMTVLRYRDLHVGNATTGTAPAPRFSGMAALAAPVAAPGTATVSVTVEAEILLVPQSP